MKEKDQSVFRSVAILSGLPVMFVAATFGLGVPIGMFYAWARVLLWNWFAVPFLHLHPIPFWVMFAVGLLISSFRPSSEALKKDHYEYGTLSRMLTPMLNQLLLLLVGYALHLTLLKVTP